MKIGWPKWMITGFIFLLMFGKGAFFVFWCIALDIVCLLYLTFRKERVLADRKAVMLAAMLGLAVLSSLVCGANVYTAMCELAKYLLYPLVYLTCRVYPDRRLLETALYHSTVFLAAGGLLSLLGLEVMPHMVIESAMRLQSFLQYANTTALVLGIGILIGLRRWRETRKWTHILALAIVSPAFLLTKSRIVFWVFVAVLSLYVFLRLKPRGRLIFAAGTGVTLVLFAALGSRLVRVSLFEPTLVERFISYYDAGRLLAQNPLGIGAGQWQFVQLSAQSAPYYVRYIHSAFFQVALDCGILGLLCFLAVLGRSLWQGFRQKNPAFYSLLLISLTGLLDAHLSFGIVIVFFAYYLSMAGSVPSDAARRAENTRSAIRTDSVPSDAARHVCVKWLALVPALILFMFLVSEFLVFYGKTKRDYTGIPAFAAARAINPWNYSVFLEMAGVEEDPDAALSDLERGYEANPQDWVFAAELSKGYAYTGRDEKAIFYAKRYFEIHTYSAVSQRNLAEALEIARDNGFLTPNQYDREREALARAIDEANAKINPLYRYIDADLRY